MIYFQAQNEQNVALALELVAEELAEATEVVPVEVMEVVMAVVMVRLMDLVTQLLLLIVVVVMVEPHMAVVIQDHPMVLLPMVLPHMVLLLMDLLSQYLHSLLHKFLLFQLLKHLFNQSLQPAHLLVAVQAVVVVHSQLLFNLP